jgi:hypothetical protein
MFNKGLLRFALRFAVAAFVLIIVLFCGFRAYTVYLTHRAVLLLDEATRIQIDANEDSILPFVARYGFVKQAQSPAEPSDDCPGPPMESALSPRRSPAKSSNTGMHIGPTTPTKSISRHSTPFPHCINDPQASISR